MDNDADAVWLAERGAELLTGIFRSVDLQVVRESAHLSLAGTQIDVGAHVDKRVQQDGQQILAVEFRIAIDGRLVPAFRAGVIGIDPSAEGARGRAAEIWSASYGAPIGYAVARWLGAGGVPKAGEGVSNSYLRVEIGSETLYRGLVGMRGPTPDAAALSSEELVRSIAGRVLPLMGDRDRFRSATVKILLHGNTATDGECLVNGNISPALLAELQKIKWPKDNADILYTLFFAAAPRTRG
jgi:hypothetical protein